ncbi:hypothetical protein Dimus_015188 [Dionaea muscipula]
MARKIVFLALFCFVLVGLAFADEKPAGATEGQGHGDQLGHSNTEPAETPGAGADDGFAVAGPVGGPVTDGAFSDSTTGAAAAPAPGTSSSGAAATSLELSALAGLAAASGFFLF